MKHIHTVALLTCLVLTAAAAEAPDPTSQIRAARLQSNRALVTHNSEAFAQSLADDFVIVRGNGVLVPSRRAWIESVEAEFKNLNAVSYERITDKIELSSVAAIAAEHGHWTATLPNGRLAYTGTYLAMWKQSADGGWQIRSELFVLLACEDKPSCAAYRK